MIEKVKRTEQHLQRRPARSFGTADRHLWEIAAVRDLFVLLLVASLLWVVYRLNDVFMPVFLAPLQSFSSFFIGGSVAGVLGMLLAIPAAACIKIFFEEVVLPPLRRWAATH